jgi:hypothetical protein
MWWWIIGATYVIGAMLTFRHRYPAVLDRYQRMSKWQRQDDDGFSYFVLAVATVFWPFVLLFHSFMTVVLLVSGLTMKILFPRGIVTKFDLEQRELEQKKQYEAARKALEAEGIKVELEE